MNFGFVKVSKCLKIEVWYLKVCTLQKSYSGSKQLRHFHLCL